MSDPHGAKRANPQKPDCYDYVRKYYGVPAYVGVRVRSIGEAAREGVLVRATSNLHYVHIRFDGMTFSVPAHPKDVEYLTVNPS